MEEDQIKYFEKIEAFVRGQLSDADRADFLEQMESDPQIKLDVETFTTADILIERNISNELKDQMNDWKAEESNLEATAGPKQIQKDKKPAVVRSLYKRLAYAATFLLLIAATFFMVPDQKSNSELAQEFAHTWVNSPDERGVMAVEETEETIAIFETYKIDKAYEKRDIAFLKQNDVPRAIYYQGLILKENKDFLLAIEKFEECVKTAEIELQRIAEWEIIITSLHNDSMNKRVEDLINKIANDPSNEYNGKAIKLQKELDSIWRKIF